MACTPGRTHSLRGVAGRRHGWQFSVRLAGVCVLVTLLAACGSPSTVATKPSPTATGVVPKATATSTAPSLLPAAPLTWRPIAPAVAPSTSGPSVAFAAAPSDGATAYACAADDNQDHPAPNPQFQVTHDHGANWVRMNDIPAGTISRTGCTLIVDGLRPSTVVVALTWSPRGSGNGQTNAYFVTLDSGASWRLLSAAQSGNSLDDLYQLATRGPSTYALRQLPTDRSSTGEHLWASDDGLRSWRRIDTTILAGMVHIWLDPNSNDILAEVSNGNGPRSLIRSTDSGQTWTHVVDGLPSANGMSASVGGNAAKGTSTLLAAHIADAPGSSGGGATNGFVVQARVAGQPWHICAWAYSLNDTSGAPNLLRCSDDSGQTWKNRVGPNFVHGPYSVTAALVVALADDGAVLATIAPANGDTILYRLAAGETRWQSLGPVGYYLTYCSTPAPGVLYGGNSGEYATAAYA